ncbi:MAG: zinc-ribbon and DUF3426 domain-containing protein [Cellvibrionales bacterium]|nr:zinc-ribbon and DUF3426 domain-containing protein [Cellvibrionales bacterium]
MIAQCPKCQASYTLTQEQLAMANGQVRCGACMTVFLAKENQVTAKSQATADLLIDDETLSDFNDDPFNIGNLDATDESWAKNLLDEKSKATSHHPASARQKKNRSLDELDDLTEFENMLLLDDDDPLHQESAPLLSGGVADLPIEFHYKGKKQLWLNAFYSLLIIALLLLAAYQVFLFRLDDASKDPKFRPYYQFGCQYLGCQLPPPFDIERVHISHLSVKSHPYLNHVLLVDMILTNTAEYAQPFPVLELFFTNEKNQIVAGKPIHPTQYLRGEMQSKKSLPIRQPIHIAMEVVDPEKSANGYFVQLRSAKKQEKK